MSGAMRSYRRSPRSLQAALATLADELAPQTLLAEVQRIWPAVVGPGIAAQALPTAERAGVVTISCSASVWAQELDLLAAQIVPRLNSQLAGGGVKRLRCVTGGPAHGGP